MPEISSAGLDLKNQSGYRVSSQHVGSPASTSGAAVTAAQGGTAAEKQGAAPTYSADGFTPAVRFSKASADPANPAGIYKSMFFPAQSEASAQGGEAEVSLPGSKKDELPDATASLAEGKSPAEVAEDGECQTCKNRKYQDGSDDPGVSFKTGGKIDKSVAASTIRSHEQEHVTRNAAKAQREGREVVSSRVVLHTGICPECGDTYYSGGTTTTVTRKAYDKAMETDPKNEANMAKTTVDTTI